MKEGEDFMSAAQNVMRHYSVESSQKTIDWLAFGGTCCMIYGTRFGTYMLRKREEALNRQRPTGTVYSMPRAVAQPMREPPPPPPPPQAMEGGHIVPEMEFEGE